MNDQKEQPRATPTLEITLRLRFRDGLWSLDSDDLRGVLVCHSNLDLVLADLATVWRKFNELSPGQCPEIPKQDEVWIAEYKRLG